MLRAGRSPTQSLPRPRTSASRIHPALLHVIVLDHRIGGAVVAVPGHSNASRVHQLDATGAAAGTRRGCARPPPAGPRRRRAAPRRARWVSQRFPCPRPAGMANRCRRSPSTPGACSAPPREHRELFCGPRRDVVDRRGCVVPVDEPAVRVPRIQVHCRAASALDRFPSARRRRSHSRRPAKAVGSFASAKTATRAGRLRGCRRATQARLCTLSPIRLACRRTGRLRRETDRFRGASELDGEANCRPTARRPERAQTHEDLPTYAGPARGATRRWTAPTWSGAPSGWRRCWATDEKAPPRRGVFHTARRL